MFMAPCWAKKGAVEVMLALSMVPGTLLLIEGRVDGHVFD